jgi:hypothetical protein
MKHACFAATVKVFACCFLQQSSVWLVQKERCLPVGTASAASSTPSFDLLPFGLTLFCRPAIPNKDKIFAKKNKIDIRQSSKFE